MPLVVLSHVPEEADAGKKLVTHLAPYKRKGVMEVWHEGLILAGGDVAQARGERLRAAELLVVLLSAEWLASDAHIEEARAARTAGCTVLPVVVRACAWEATPHVAGLMPLPRDGRPVLAAADVDQAWHQVAEGIVETLRYHPATDWRARMLRIPAGKFVMGSTDQDADTDERPHEVEITRPFLLGETEVTQTQYQALTGKAPSYFKGDQRPVERVTWSDTIEYCNLLSDQEQIGRCYEQRGDDVKWIVGSQGYRLPTEAEWEYAARAAQGTRYSGSDQPSEVAWYRANSSAETHSVKTRSANKWGLYDMSGNVWEWVWDWYSPDHSTDNRDPRGPDAGTSRVRRGGSAWVSPSSLRVARRSGHSIGASNIGFRVARSLR